MKTDFLLIKNLLFKTILFSSLILLILLRSGMDQYIYYIIFLKDFIIFAGLGAIAFGIYADKKVNST